MDHMTLLEKHCPQYFFDYRETCLPCSLNEYVTNKQFVCNGTVIGQVQSTNRKTLLLHYFLFFEKDLGMKLCFKVVDAHKYDMEQVTVEVNQGGTVLGVCYQPHGIKEHYWLRGERDLKTVLHHNAQPRVYVSKDKHAIYPLQGRIWRYCGAANDICKQPKRQMIRVEQPCFLVTKEDYIDSIFRSINRRMHHVSADPRPCVPLSTVKTRMLLCGLNIAK